MNAYQGKFYLILGAIYCSLAFCDASSHDSYFLLAPPKEYFTAASYTAKFAKTTGFCWWNGYNNFINLTLTKRELSQTPQELFEGFSYIHMFGMDDDVRYHSLTGLRLDNVEIRNAYGGTISATITRTNKWELDAGGRGVRLGPDDELIPIPDDPARDFAEVYYIYKNFQIFLHAKGPGTTDRFSKLDLFCLETNKRIDIFRASEEADKQLAAFTWPKGISQSLQVKIDSFKAACKAYDYKRALNMLDALRNELKALRGRQVPETLFQALSKAADEFEAATRFLMNPVLPPPAANITPAPTGGQN